MKANGKGIANQARGIKRGDRLIISCLALAIASALPLTAMAGVHTANDSASLGLAIIAANGDTDANVTIQLTGNITVIPATLTEAPVKAMTIDTQGFTLTGPAGNTGTSGALGFSSMPGPVTLVGTFVGGTGDATNANPAGAGISTISGTDPSSLINNGSITGGASIGATGPGGSGLNLNVTTFVNSDGATVKGGMGVGATRGGSGAQLRRGTTLTNYGLIEGGDSQNSVGGTGVDVGGPGTPDQLTNHGTIRGGASLGGSASGGTGVNVRVGTLPIVNTGTIEGGNAARAILSNVDLSLTNSGIIRAGTAQSEAIRMSLPANVLTLELQAGSDITGIVFAGLTATTDTLRLGGTSDATFDASSIGATAQYQNFEIFQKTGTSTWTLTGTGTAVTPWDIQQGTLRIDSDANLGDPSANVTFSGGTLETTADITTQRGFIFNGTGTIITDAGTTFTQNGVLSGGSLVKDGAGTLVLGGVNYYVGGTTIRDGELRIGNPASLGPLGSVVTFLGGTLHTTASIDLKQGVALSGTGRFLTDANTTLMAYGIGGPGNLIKDGEGTLVLFRDNSYTGATTVDGGLLKIENSSVTSPVTVNAAGTLGGNGTIHGNLTNAGTVAPGDSIGALTVDGNYIGQGGTLAIEANLDGDASPADRLVVTGDTSGTTNVKVTKVGGNGAQTVEGIKIIDVQGASNGAFNLVGDYVFQGQQAVVSGAYAYRLYKNGVATPTDGDWYLRSNVIQPADTGTPPTGTPPSGPTGNPPTEPQQPLYAPSVPLYEAYAGVLQQFNQLGTLRQRVGDRAWATDGTAKSDASATGAWARVESEHSNISPDRTTTGTHYDATTQKLQVGLDMMLGSTDAGSWVAGVTGQYGRIDSNVSSLFGLGRIKTHGHGFGGTLTWYGSNGFYVDAQAEYNWYRTDLSSRTLGHMLVDDNKGAGYGAGVEAGWKFPFSTGWSLTPQAQLTYSSVRFDGFGDQYGAQVSRKDSDAMTARAGLALDHETSWQSASGKASHSHVYGIANLYYDFLDGTKVDVSGNRLTSKNQPMWVGVGMGGSLAWGDDRYSLYGEATANSSVSDFRDSHSAGVKVGFSMKW